VEAASWEMQEERRDNELLNKLFNPNSRNNNALGMILCDDNE